MFAIAHLSVLFFVYVGQFNSTAASIRVVGQRSFDAKSPFLLHLWGLGFQSNDKLRIVAAQGLGDECNHANTLIAVAANRTQLTLVRVLRHNSRNALLSSTFPYSVDV